MDAEIGVPGELSQRRGRARLAALGPGMLFAAAAVGVSHLVQSTRAGAEYGLGLVGLVLLANAMKYPAFRLGPYYAAVTGRSLLEGYRRQGRGALVVYALVTVGTMFTVQAAVTVVTAALAISALGLPVTPWVASLLITVACMALLGRGSYRWLDRITKVLVGVLTVSTLLATSLVLPRVDFSSLGVVPAGLLSDPKAAFFAAALVGWMPSAIDVSVWQSLWTLARSDDTGHAPSLKDASFDFHLGYLGTALLALCFVVLGAGVMHQQGLQFQESATGFTAQVITLYTAALGEWARPLIGVAALAVMFSTTLTVVDGFPRALTTLTARFRGEELPQLERAPATQKARRKEYLSYLLLMTLGSLAVIAWLLSSLQALVDMATTLSFMTAPVLALLNHRAVQGPEVPTEARPSRALLRASALCIGLQGLFALYYVYLRFIV